MGPRDRQLLHLIRPYLPVLGLAGLLVTFDALLTLVTPRLTGFAVDGVIRPAGGGAIGYSLGTIVVLLLAVFAVRSVVNYAQIQLTRVSGSRILRDLRKRTFDHLVGLSPDFFETRRIGELLSRLSSDVEQVQRTVSQEIPGGIRALLVFVGTLAMLLSMHVGLTLLCLALVPPIVGLALWYGRKHQKLSRELQDSRADVSARAEEVLSGIQTVQAFGAESFEQTRFGDRLAGLFGLERRQAGLVAGFSSLLLFLGSAAFAAVLWYGGTLIARGTITAGEFTAFLLYAFAIGNSLGSLGSLYVSVRTLRGSAERVLEILASEPTVATRSIRPLPVPLIGAIQFSEVSYRYPTREELAVDRVSLEIAGGETVALVGASGAGKSTLFSLLLRFRDPTAGHITLDGMDTREIAPGDLRRAISLVSQDVFLFHGTVRDNIRYGRPDASADDIETAAAAAHAAEFIETLPNGYQTQIGERGVTLSAGQKQRIAIARAFLRDARILLLDEATSALDADSEHHVQTALHALMKDRTTLVIAHRLATARRADRIGVLDRGQLLAIDRHEPLYQRSELYRRYWDLQSSATLSSCTGSRSSLG